MEKSQDLKFFNDYNNKNLDQQKTKEASIIRTE